MCKSSRWQGAAGGAWAGRPATGHMRMIAFRVHSGRRRAPAFSSLQHHNPFRPFSFSSSSSSCTGSGHHAPVECAETCSSCSCCIEGSCCCLQGRHRRNTLPHLRMAHLHADTSDLQVIVPRHTKELRDAKLQAG